MAAHLDAKTLSEIDAAYVAFQTRTITPVQALALDAPPTLDVASRSVPPAEALAMRSRVWRLTRSQQMLALGDANTAISLDPKSPEGYLARASVLSLVGNPRASIQDLRTALRLSPADSRVRRGLGSVLLALEGPTTEVKGLVEWVRPRATSAEDFRFLATWELRMRHPERSLELATKGVSLDIGCIACYELAAEAASRTGDRKGAVRFQHQAVNIAAEGANPKMLERLAILENALKAPAPAKNLSPDAEKEAMVAAVRARRPEFDACYEPARAKTPTLRGKVNVFFVVRADGAVTDVKSHGSTLPDAGVVACVLDRIRIQKFDAPAKGARALRITFVFPKKADGSSEDPAPEPTAP